MDLYQTYRSCVLCPRSCSVNRTGNDPHLGTCGESDQLRVAHVGPHFGEEPPITGRNGSGAVFFSGCPLRCIFCQNYQISHTGVGSPVHPNSLRNQIEHMIRAFRVHNINLVTPDHFVPHIIYLVQTLRHRGFDLPVVFNGSGYHSLETLKLLEPHIDVYLPDFKYADRSLARRLSRCSDYPGTALSAVSEMLRQKGHLQTEGSDLGLAEKGVLVRHLILPGKIQNSIKALTMLYVEFGPSLRLSLMAQYHPVTLQGDTDLNRTLRQDEFLRVLDHATDLGFEDLFVQFPNFPGRCSPFLPDFEQNDPFRAWTSRV